MRPTFSRLDHITPFGFNTFGVDGFNRFGHGGFGRDGFGRDGFGHHRRFFNTWGWGWGGWPSAWGWGWGGWPYATDYSGFDYDQAQNQYDPQYAQSAQLQVEIQDDEQRQMQLEQELADQRAADSAERYSRPRNPAPAPAQTESQTPPTVLVYRDHHEVEVRNYAIAGNTIFDLGPHWTRKIAISDLDIAATVAANEERGVEFRLPDSPVKVKQQ